ncbi:hypothetical protein SSX86_017064 [Deinandra increscens subsp. villosa]|uniref:DUF7733 domain-containing protein n=1 Tax=Deinandra increscens subsp. villosa TaxID=3103831 RepID=A0AAP0GWF2_9ASTR
MSGGVAPIPLPTQNPPLNLRRGLLSFQNLNAAALALILSASGMVGVQDIAFVLLSLFYIFFLSKFAFPTLSTTPPPPIFSDHQRLLTLYVSIGALIGLLLPVAYILHGAIEGDKNGIKSAAPHAFLMASQVLVEAVTFSGGFSLPVRVFVPVVYNAMRMYAILDWVKVEMMRGDEGGSGRRLVVGRSIAVANMVFWGFNLFGFLLPVYMPKAFKKYYTDNDKDS